MRPALGPAMLIVLCLLAGSSCSDLGMFAPPAEGAVTIDALSLSEGSFAAPGQGVSFVLREAEPRGAAGRLLDLEVQLQDERGNAVWSAEVDSPLINEPLSLSLPALATGRYRLALRVNGEDGLLQERRLTFFCLAEQYAVTGIRSYPPTIMPNREGRVTAEFIHPAGADPYVRWSRDGDILARGRLSEGLAELTWPAPREEGVYTVQVELFPVSPPAGEDFPTVSPIVAAARLFVSSKPLPGSEELGPPGSYYALLHFAGSLLDAAPGARETEAELVGSARLVESGATAGYLLPAASGAGIRYPRSILPVQEGRLQPCTLTLKLVPSEAQGGTNLLSVSLAQAASGASDGLLLRIQRASSGEIQAWIGAAGRELLLPSGIMSLEAGRGARLDLSLIPGPSGLQGIWFLDGRQTAAHLLSFAPEPLEPKGLTLIGGEDNIGVTLTELGVYYRDESGRPAVDPGIFRAAAAASYGSRLVLAEGFDGLYPPSAWTLAGETRSSAGLLSLLPDARLRLPYLELGPGQTLVSLAFAAVPPEGSRIALFWEGQGDPFAEIDPRGLLRDPARPAEGMPIVPVGTRLDITLSAGSLSVPGSEGPVAISLTPPGGTSAWITLQLSAPPSPSALARPPQAASPSAGPALDSVLIYRN